MTAFLPPRKRSPDEGMDETHRCRLETLGKQSVIEAGQFMGVDAIGHSVTQPRLNVKLIPPHFPIAAPRLTSLSTPCRSRKKLIDQDIKRGVDRDRGSTRVFNLQAGEGQFRILFRSMDSPRRLAPLTSQRISDADPDKEPSWFEFSDVAASAHELERTGEDRTDTLAGMARKCIEVHCSAANAEGRPRKTDPDLRLLGGGGKI